MSIELEKINECCIRKVANKGRGIYNKENTRGYDIFPDPYCNVGIVSKKKSGKTTVIYNILNKCADKKSNIMIFCGTVHKDAVWKSIKEMLEKRGCNVDIHTSFIEDGVNIVSEFMEIEGAEEEKEDSDGGFNPENCKYKCADDLPKNEFIEIYKPEEIEKAKEQLKMYQKWKRGQGKKKKPKKKLEHYAKWILVFDDLGEALKNKAIAQLVKTNRHYNAMVILSSQRDTDFSPSTWGQFDYFLTFRSLNEEVIERIWEKLNLSTDLNEFIKIYRSCTDKPYSFLYLDVPKEEYRCKFDKKVIK